MSIILIVEPPANHTFCIFVNEGSLNNLLYDVIITLVQYIKRRFTLIMVTYRNFAYHYVGSV